VAIRLLHIPALLLTLLAAGCQSAAHSKARHTAVGWRPIISWTGRGDSQTDSFDISSTQWRIKWETKGASSPGAGTLHVVVHSEVSGRPIADAINHTGNGHGIAYVTEDPRLYHLEIQSQGLDWSLKVEEAVIGEVP